MSERQQAPKADEGATFIVHEQLVETTLHAINLFLHLRDDLLDMVHAFLSLSARQVNAQTDEHDRQGTIL